MDSEFQIKLDGKVVAGIAGPAATSGAAMRYAHQYAEDGPVTVQQKVNGRWRTFAKVTPTGRGPIGETE